MHSIYINMETDSGSTQIISFQASEHFEAGMGSIQEAVTFHYCRRQAETDGQGPCGGDGSLSRVASEVPIVTGSDTNGDL